MPKIKLNTRYLWKGTYYGSDDGSAIEVEVPDEFLQVYPHLKPPDKPKPEPKPEPEPESEPKPEPKQTQQGSKK